MCFNPVPSEISNRISVDLNESSTWHVLAGYRFIQIIIPLNFIVFSYNAVERDHKVSCHKAPG